MNTRNSRMKYTWRESTYSLFLFSFGACELWNVLTEIASQLRVALPNKTLIMQLQPSLDMSEQEREDAMNFENINCKFYGSKCCKIQQFSVFL